MKKECLPKSNEAFRHQKGFSMIELIIVILLTAIISAAAIMSFVKPKQYAADDQALKILDVLQEARQRAINQKSFMRVEFNNTTNQVKLIDENAAGTTTDDLVIKTVPFNTGDVNAGVHPANVSLTNVPVETSPINEAVFSSSQYAPSNTQSVFTLCFVKDGRVVEASANGSCLSTNTLRGATIYVYAKPDSSGKSSMVRAITVNGVSAAANIVKCTTDSTNTCVSWKK